MVQAHLLHVAWTHVRVLLVVEFFTIYVSVTCVNNVMLSSHYIILNKDSVHAVFFGW